MLRPATRRRLTHLTGRILICARTPTTTCPVRCVLETCMSPVLSDTAPPERIKRRRLNGWCPSGARAYSRMAPLLMRPVEDESAPPGKLELTDIERAFQSLLVDVAHYIDETPAVPHEDSQTVLSHALSKEPLTLRFTGGWVRDKLLGVPSHDIDVAINKLTGYQFGVRMKEYLEIPGHLEKHGLKSIATNDKQSQKAGTTNKSKMVGGLHKIEANPEKSKHLETTTLRILGLDVDLVNLRRETYSDNSRNPQVEFGTPEEDALRRDATVNAMFFNITTEEIEDFTGRGFDDMRNRIIRTPLEPYQTFKDDPLRVLRLIRFASRLDYTIEAETLAAMDNPDIKDALQRKISRERVGTELEKALQGPNPHEALRLIFSLNLYRTVFSDPTVVVHDNHIQPDLGNWEVTINTLRDIMAADDTLSRLLVSDSHERYLAWQLAALVPYRDAPAPEPSGLERKPPPPVSVSVAREGIKVTNKTSDVILSAVRHQAEISNVVDQLHEKLRRPEKMPNSEDPTARDVLGMAIRRWGESWRSQVLYAMLVDIAKTSTSSAIQLLEHKYTRFMEHVRDLDLLDVCALKPLLDGTNLAKAIGIPPGPWMKEALNVVMAWQLRNPGVTNPQQAIEEVQNSQPTGELTHRLVRHFLQLTIRPLFIKAQPPHVTAQGRKKVTPILPKRLTMQNQDDSISKPWKESKHGFALDLLRWVVASLSETIVEEVWPFVVPPVLTLLDDWETGYKREGAERLDALLQVTPPLLLERTGLGDVFSEALLSCLTYLPSITPESESVALLSATYPALLSLTRIRFSTPALWPMKSGVNRDDIRHRIRFLDNILRNGIIYGFAHCSNHSNISVVLFRQLSIYLDEFGIDSVKNLKFVLPILTETLSRLSDLQTLLSAIGGMQALIRNCWPRLVNHRGEILKGLCLCWLTAQEDATGKGQAEVEKKLRETMGMLTTAIARECDFENECQVLLNADERLGGLFRDRLVVHHE